MDGKKPKRSGYIVFEKSCLYVILDEKNKLELDRR